MRIAILEDDRSLSELVCHWLTVAGHEPHAFASGATLLALIHNGKFDALLLDWNVPELTGIEVLKSVREHNRRLPILFCTARGEEADVVKALGKGADAYLVKPVRRMELLERLESVVRRARRPQQSNETLEIGSIRADTGSRTVACDGRPVELTTKDFELAVFFLRNLGRLISRTDLQECVWGRSGRVTSRTLDTHVSRIRAKLGLIPKNGWRLTAVYRHGYRLELVEASAAHTPAGGSAPTPSAIV